VPLVVCPERLGVEEDTYTVKRVGYDTAGFALLVVAKYNVPITTLVVMNELTEFIFPVSKYL
jgi:gamma-glutamyl:cysteine ligase YbdK (ATP-grasp superfamily)